MYPKYINTYMKKLVTKLITFNSITDFPGIDTIDNILINSLPSLSSASIQTPTNEWCESHLMISLRFATLSYHQTDSSSSTHMIQQTERHPNTIVAIIAYVSNRGLNSERIRNYHQSKSAFTSSNYSPLVGGKSQLSSRAEKWKNGINWRSQIRKYPRRRRN